jgi:hypothetical protein
MKVIFLDIDGVLNCSPSNSEWDDYGYPPPYHNGLIATLKQCWNENMVNSDEWKVTNERVRWVQRCVDNFKLFEATGAYVVISSTWRVSFEEETAFKVFQEMFKLYDINMKIIGFTPVTFKGFRGDEVETWLLNHPEVTSFVILDDMPDFKPEQFKNFVQTDSRIGLTEENVLQAISILNSVDNPSSQVVS